MTTSIAGQRVRSTPSTPWIAKVALCCLSFSIAPAARAEGRSALAAAVHPADEQGLQLVLKRGGDVTWKGSCRADVFRAEGAEVIRTLDDVEAAFSLPRGRYHLLVACPTTEGTVRRVLPISVDRLARGIRKETLALEPGFLLVQVLRYDTPVTADVFVYDELGREIARGKERAVLPVRAGFAHVVAQVKEDGKQRPRPLTGNLAVTIRAKEKSSVDVDTTDGKLTVQLTNNGAPASGIAALRQPGQRTRLAELKSGVETEVPPGTYDLVTTLDATADGAEVVTRGIVITPQGAVSRTVAHQTGTLEVDGRGPDGAAQAEIELFHAGRADGAPEAFAKATTGQVLLLAPGPIRIAGRLSGVSLDDGSSPRAETTATVRPGARARATLGFSWAELSVTTSVGGKTAPLQVSVAIPGASPLLRVRADGLGQARVRVPAGRYLVTATLDAPQGPVVTEQQVTLKNGASGRLRLDLKVGTAVIQAFREGVAVAADVRFLRDGDTVLSVPAGQDAVLAAGTYDVVIVKKAQRYPLGAVVVAPGATVSRSLQLPPDP